MSLSDLKFKTRYKTNRGDDLLNGFYLPALKETVIYERAVGYFRSSSLILAARGLSTLLHSDNGMVRLIASPDLSADDIEAIKQGYESRDDVVSTAAKRALENVESQLGKNRLSILSWLISEGRLDVKLAIRTDDLDRATTGIYHEKIGVMHDSQGNSVSFEGSSNETMGGLFHNFESVSVHRSWADPEGRAAEIKDDFNLLWKESEKGVRVLDFTKVTSEFLAEYKNNSRPTKENEIDSERAELINVPITHERTGFYIPPSLKLREYQSDVIEAWIRKKCHGTYALATGTGKTFTAIASAARVRANGHLNAIIVLCPYKNLVNQWSDELEKCGADVIKAYEGTRHWINDLTRKLNRPDLEREWPKSEPLLCVVTTFNTFSSDPFQDLLDHFPRHSLLIADEAHHVGAEDLSSKLPGGDVFPYRLALSATPERYNDEDGTERIYDWFGGVLQPEVGLKDAIENGFLCPYYYKPIFIHLDEEERFHHNELMSRIASLLQQGHKFGTSRQLGALANERSAFLATVKGKTRELRDLLTQIRDKDGVDKTLIYCGVGSRPDTLEPTQKQIAHVDEIVALVGGELGIVCGKYTYETTNEQRESLLQGIERDPPEFEAVIAINCLDEGVDIPCIHTAVILSSSANPRQFVQRRGRVLRKHLNKEHATIYDMVVVPSISDEQPSKAEKTLMERELKRYLEFSRAAINYIEAEDLVIEIQKQFGLFHL